MKPLTSLACLLTAATASATLPYAAATTGSVEQAYPDSNYSAILSDGGTRWRLLDVSGATSAINVRGCGARFEIPLGLWLLTRDAAGNHKLVAPSSTPLPNHHAGEVAIAACGEPARANTLRLPAALIAALDSHASSILIQR
jgi:hypothetical protein